MKKYLDLWVNGVSRENMTVEDFDTVLLKSAFNNGKLEFIINYKNYNLII